MSREKAVTKGEGHLTGLREHGLWESLIKRDWKGKSKSGKQLKRAVLRD